MTRLVDGGRLPPLAFVVSSTWALAFGACSESVSDPPPPPSEDPVASVELLPVASVLVAIDDTVAFSATARDAEGAAMVGEPVTWASSDSGVAEIDSLGVAKALANGTTTITAAIGGVTDSAALTVTQQGTSLRIAITPDGAAAGVAFSIQPVVQIVDRNGHVTTNDDTTAVAASLGSGDGEIVGAHMATAQAGVATFMDLGVRGRVGERTLRFEADGLTAAVSDAFPLMAGPPEALGVRVGPDGAKAGVPLATQPVIEIRDANGNVAADDDSTVITVTIDSGGGSIISGGTVTVQDGVATFTELAIGGGIGDRTLRFEAEGLTAGVSGAFPLAPGSPAALHVQVEPGDGVTGSPLAPQPIIEIHDGYGNVTEDADATVVTAVIASGGGSIADGGTVTAENGVATFTDLAIDGAAGARTLRFTAQGLTPAESEPFALTASAPASLVIRIQPGGATAGVHLATQPVIEIRDANGNIAGDDDATVVTAVIASGGGSLTGATATAQNGVATFTNLAIGGNTGQRTLRFNATGLEPAVSEAFALAAGPGAALHVQVEPGDAEVGAPLSPQPVIEVRDAYGNVTDGDDTTAVTAVIASGGGSIAGGGTATVENGVATFTDLAIDGAGGERTLRFTAEGLTPAESEPFTLTASAPASLRIRVEPGGARAGVRLATQPVIEIRDANGDIANDDDATVITAVIASGGGSLTGATATAQNGVATFTNLAIGGNTGQRTLRFVATGLEPAVSEAFALAPGPAATISLHNGDGQTGRADTDLPVPLAVLVHDAFDNGVPDVAVDWTVTAGDGTVRSDDGPTNEDGVTSAVYRLGPHAGDDTIEASAAGIEGSPVTFTATSTPNARISGTVTRVAGSTSAGVLAQLNGSAGPGGRGAAAGFTMMSASSSAARGRLLALAGAGGDVAAASGPPPQPLPTAQQPQFVPDELIVTFRAQPLGAPPIGASAYRAPAAAAAVATSMRRVLEPHEQITGTTVVGVSPAILTARLRVDPRMIPSTEQALRADPAIERVERNAIVYSSEIPLGASVPGVPPVRVGGTLDPNPLPRWGRGNRAGLAGAHGMHAGMPAVLPWRSSGGFAASLATVTPNDAFYAWQAWHYHMIDLPRAWDITTGRASVVVAVLDDGIRFDHPDIAPNLTNDGYDFVSEGSVTLCSGGPTPKAGDGDGYDPYPETPVRHRWADTCAGDIESNGGHGLHVAGIIGASSNNGGGVAGVNWNVSIRPVRVLDITGRGTHYDVAQGLLYAAGLPADDGAGGAVAAPSVARIINLSFAGPQSSMLLEDAVGAAANAGALIVAAAGNAATSTPNYPAAYPQTVSVSAVQPDGSLASYSSFGPTIDIAAPGGETSLGCDFGVWSTTWNFVRNLRSFSCWAGTSMAAPHVTGVAALLLAAQPGLNAAQLRARILEYAVPAGDPTRFGAGIVNARNSLTLSHAPARSLHVRLIDADNGANVADAMAAPNGSYTFGELDDGNYYVYAGEDEGGDGVIGVPVRRWGAAGGSAAPTVIAVDGADEYPVSFEIGVPLALATPPPDPGSNVLPIGGYLTGGPAAQGVHDFVLEVPATGTYVFETSAVSGACGFALEADTRLRLYNEAFGLIASNDDIDPAAGNLCARITQTLQPGTVHLEVLDVSGRYAVSARRRP